MLSPFNGDEDQKDLAVTKNAWYILSFVFSPWCKQGCGILTFRSWAPNF
jgi:hypothetical protein